ncbi:MAG: sigma-70 family RNA polymerase sigma factor [Bacteroidota bacterium]
MLLTEQTDEALMALVSKGDLEVLKLLFDRHHLHVFNFLHKMCGDRQLSEDLTQDVFYKVIKYRSTYNNGRFISWLFTIARNGLKTHFSRNHHYHETLEGIAEQPSNAPNNTEEYSQLHLALGMLESSDREVLVLHKLQEVRYPELAEILGSTPGAVKTKVSRALKKLKEIYTQKL